MIEIDDALALVESHASPLSSEERATTNSLNCILAEDILADVDSPPHDKALVDGWAIRVEDANAQLRILEQIVASQVPTLPIQPGTATQVMTGAPVPVGTEAMVMTEQCTVDGETVHVSGNAKPGQHIMRRASSFSRGETLLHQGHRIRAIEIGLMHEVGRVQVRCYSKPKVAVLPTGEELVSASQQPKVGQIRNSNGPMLASRAAQMDCVVESLDVAKDNAADLRAKIERGLRADVLILSGGVSMGVKDLVPPTLDALGVRKVFHKVRLKPGKPIWFGVLERADDKPTLVFGLPGNPVSSLVCFELFVDTAIRRLSGDASQRWSNVELCTPIEVPGDRTVMAPANLYRTRQASVVASPIQWKYSGDMRRITQANGWIRLEASRSYAAGDCVPALTMGARGL